jgi:hypothetical protein
MRSGLRISLAAILLLFLVFPGPAQAADIESYAQARDRLEAQLVGDNHEVLEVLGDPALRTGPIDVTAGAQSLRLGHGPGWLFAVRLNIGKNPLYAVAFVGQDATVDVGQATAAPQGLSASPRREAARRTAAVTGRDEAYAVLLADLLGHSAQGRRIYAAAAKVETSSVSVATWMDAVTVSGGPGWLFFVDDVPKANWTHACRYVLVGQDGAVHVQKAKTPPNDMAAFTELTTWPQSDARLSGLTAKAAAPTALTAAAVGAAARQSTPAANRYAVIISGGWNQFNNHIRYWNDCAFFYNTLKQHGFQSDHITVLFADGTDPAVDRSDGVSSPLDFDGDTVPDINYSATRANIATVFSQLGATLGPDDILYIFTTDHGGAQSGNVAPYNTPNVVLYLWGEIINGDELAAEVNKVTAKAMVGIFEQCFSGGMVEKLAATNRVLMSASRWWELSYAMGPDFTYDEFSYYVTTALADASKGDTNGDGVVTMEEAYLYALARDSYQNEGISGGDNLGEHPAYRSDPWDLGRTLSLGGIDASARPPILAGYSQFETDEAFPTPDPSAAQGWHADDATWSHALPFPFPLAGTSYSNVSVSSNGLLYFANPSTSGVNTIAGLTASLAIAPHWDNLTTADSGYDIYVTDTGNHVTFVWQARTYVDQRPVNVGLRLYPDGHFTLYYGTGNELTSRVTMRDKTIGVATGAVLHPALRNGVSDLGSALAMDFRKAAYPWAVPAISLLLSE